MLALVVYDIPDDRKRDKLATFLEEYGRRVQYSAFEYFISLAEMRQLHQKLKTLVKSGEDNVRSYWIPAKAVSKALTIGSAPPEKPPDVYIV